LFYTLNIANQLPQNVHEINFTAIKESETLIIEARSVTTLDPVRQDTIKRMESRLLKRTATVF